MKLRLGLWRERYSVEDKGLSFVREAEDYRMLVTPEQVQSYERSDHAMLAKELFQQLKLTKRAVTQTEYCCVRDHMYSVIHFGTGHRSGVSANLLMSEFRKATFINGSYDICVWNHKTVKTYGPAGIVLTPLHYTWLKTFVENIRSQLTCKASNVFLSWTGAKQKSGDISKRVHALWCKAGLFDNISLPKNLSCNIIRKSTTTGLREHKKGHYQETADLMGHSTKTAEKHYYMRQKVKTSAKASEVIRSHFYGLETISPINAPTTPKKKWSEKEVNEIKGVFGEDAVSLNDVSLAEVNDKKDRITEAKI